MKARHGGIYLSSQNPRTWQVEAGGSGSSAAIIKFKVNMLSETLSLKKQNIFELVICIYCVMIHTTEEGLICSSVKCCHASMRTRVQSQAPV